MSIGITEILLLILTLIFCTYLWLKYNLQYWKRHHVPHIKPKFFFGNIKDIILFRKSTALTMTELYSNPIIQNEPIIGIYLFNQPALLIREPELIKRILIKDFHCFSNRYMQGDKHNDNMGFYNLKFVKNPIWKQMRSKLTPVFTTGKIKQMFHSVNNIGKQFDEYLNNLTKTSKNVCVEMKELCALYTTDVIASVAYGIEANSIQNPDGEFRQNGRKIFQDTPYRAFEFLIFTFVPWLSSWLKVKIFNKEATQFLRTTINYVMNERIKSGITRNDLIDTLISIRKETQSSQAINNNEIKLDGDILVAQAAIFYIAGFEPTSTSMSMGLYELSKKPQIQKRLREEIYQTLSQNNGELTFELLNSMTYLNMIMLEILRLYPGLAFLERAYLNTTNNDDQNKINANLKYSLKPYSNFEIPNGMPVYIPIYSLHRDPKYFPNPDEFDPERFSLTNKDQINHNVYMPFGSGPRICIGERFGLMQTKIGILNFFKNHRIQLSEKSEPSIELANTVLIISKNGIYCEIIEDRLFQ